MNANDSLRASLRADLNQCRADSRRRIKALETQLATLRELADAAAEYVWVCLDGNLGARTDAETEADFRHAVTNWEIENGIRRPDVEYDGT